MIPNHPLGLDLITFTSNASNSFRNSPRRRYHHPPAITTSKPSLHSAVSNMIHSQFEGVGWEEPISDPSVKICCSWFSFPLQVIPMIDHHSTSSWFTEPAAGLWHWQRICPLHVQVARIYGSHTVGPGFKSRQYIPKARYRC